MLVGTSFSAHQNAFPTYIKHLAGAEIRAAVWRAQGPVRPLGRAIRECLDQCFPKTLIWEIPTHEIFCYSIPLRGLGQVLVDTPSPHLSGLAELVGLPAGVFVHASPALKIGPNAIGGKRVLLRPAPGLEMRAFAGELSLRLRGRLTGNPLVLEVGSGADRLTMEWRPGVEETVVPIVGIPGKKPIVISLRARSGRARLDLRDTALLADVDPAGGKSAAFTPASSASRAGWSAEATFDPPVPIGPDTLALVAAGGLPETAFPVRIEILGEDGAPPAFSAEVSANPARVAVLAVAGSSLHGRLVRRVKITGAGAPPEGLLSRVVVFTRPAAAPR